MRAKKQKVWDRVRKRNLVLTPEEEVRRGILEFLSAKIPATSIAQEYPIELNGTSQRADIVVFGRDARPLMLVECKAPEVTIDQSTLAQAFRYNSVLHARYVMLTNGRDNYLYQIDEKGEYSPLRSFPESLGILAGGY